MLMVAVLVIHGIVEDMFSQRSIGYDLIVGPKGSPQQLVLNTIYRVGAPIENLPFVYYEELKNMPIVAEAVPFCLGDVTEQGGFPIVGTTEQYFLLPYAPNRRFAIRGRGFQTSWDAIIGSRVARENRWDVGSKFKMVHGGVDSDHVHDEEFTVTAVLDATGTPNDKTVFVHLNGFFAIQGHDKPPEEALKRLQDFYPDDPKIQALTLADVAPADDHDHDHGAHDHGHHHHAITDYQKEVTAVLLKMKYPTATIMFASELKKGFQAQAVNPIIIMSQFLQDVVGNVRRVLVVLTSLIIAVSGVSIFVSIYNSMSERRREIAIMRALGARRGTVFSIILAESILLCFGGGLLGLLLGHGLVFAAGPIVERASGILIDPFAFEPVELVLLPILIALASIVGFVPGMTAYRTDVAKALAD
jgi:putative ABC transport system permease protein